MTINVGTFDRVFRLVLGILLVAAPFVSGMTVFNTTAVTAISLVAGFILLGTMAMKFCPLYYLFGIRTCKI